MKKILYISYTAGMLEPLGQSQVLNYLYLLPSDYSITLISFEKVKDLANEESILKTKRKCKKHNIDWKYYKFHYSTQKLAKALDLFKLIFVTMRYSLNKDIQIVHCRSYVSAMAACISSVITKKPFIFDMRALWPDELVTAGRIKKDFFYYKILKKLEQLLLNKAAKIISLTNAAVTQLVKENPTIEHAKIIVIPTCANLQLLTKSKKLYCSCSETPFIVGTIGTLLSGWFCLDSFFKFFLEIKKNKPSAKIVIVSKDNKDQLFNFSDRFKIKREDISIYTSEPEKISNYLEKMNMGVMFYKPDLGRAPTRFAEFLAKGIPVVSNRGVGDVASMIENHNLGKVVSDITDETELITVSASFLKDYDNIIISDNCREIAKKYFSVEMGAREYHYIYNELIN